MKAPPDLARLYREGRLVPFIGAGVSMGVTWTVGGQEHRGPSWREMVDFAIQELGIDPPDLLRTRGSDLQILEYFKIKNHGVAPLTNMLSARMNPPDSDLRSSPVHTALADLVKTHLIYTTNYDDFVERALRLHGRSARTVAIPPHMGQANDGVEVVKFHGDFNHPQTMVVTESDYQDRLRLKSPMDYRLTADLIGRAVLFLGYSFQDPNVSYLFRMINSEFSLLSGTTNGRRAYIVSASPSDFENELFRSRNIEVLAAERDLTAEIVELLEDLREHDR